MLKPIMALVRRQGVRAIIYLDDLLIIGDSKTSVLKHVALCRYVLEKLGFVVNTKKSILEPVQTLEFLGFQINSVSQKVSVPDSKIQSISKAVTVLKSANLVSLRDIARVLGQLKATSRGLLPASYFCRNLQQCLLDGLFKFSSYDEFIVLSSESRSELDLWLSIVFDLFF